MYVFVTGLFHGVIAQSGVATARYSVYGDDNGVDFRQYVRDVGHLFSCSGGRGAAGLQDVIACLRRVPQHDIIDKRGSVCIRQQVSKVIRQKAASSSCHPSRQRMHSSVACAGQAHFPRQQANIAQCIHTGQHISLMGPHGCLDSHESGPKRHLDRFSPFCTIYTYA